MAERRPERVDPETVPVVPVVGLDDLDDRYRLDRGRVYLTGIQALVRLLLVQQRLDRARGWNTAGFVSGYRGSPLGGLDLQLWAAREHLAAHRIHFEPGLNEDLAATAVWGSQQVGLFPGARHEGVFGLWYGKAPGVDRSGDALRHANFAGSSPRGGVLAVAGDDPACKSSTLPSQSEFAFMDLEIPVLAPADVGEVLELGLHGWAMSRLAGSWVGLIALADTMDSTASVPVDTFAFQPRLPRVELPPGGLHIRRGDSPHAQEERVRHFRLPAARAYARANGLDRVVVDSPRPRLGIAAAGRAYLAVRQALDDLGIGPEQAAGLGLRVLKVGMPWPLDPETARSFADGLEEVVVVESKRSLVEWQLRDALYELPDGRRPRVVGKRDERGAPLLRDTGELRAAEVAEVLASRLPEADAPPEVERRLARLHARAHAAPLRVSAQRTPWFCSGCPHNTSTRLPEGSRALAGIGCHFMVQWMDRETDLTTQMGGEGVPWIGQAPFTDEPHLFANLGDGTYVHSGILAVRAAVTAGVNLTFKVLYNDAVAMTGGQPAEGMPDVARVTRQLAAEGVARIVVVADDPAKYPAGLDWAPGVAVHARSQLDRVQRELREVPGVTVLVYDQACAAETRRKRKRGLVPEPPRRVFINERVCEGCGDCAERSNCLSVESVDTEFGRKRHIDQSSCNKDFSCLDGSCPALVTVEGARPRRRPPADLESALADLPAAAPAAPVGITNVLLTGVGGTGVTTVAALLGMAAHLDGLECATLDMTGLAQKGGAVTSHVRIAPPGAALHGPRVPAASTDVLLACDTVVAASPEVQELLDPERTRGVAEAAPAPTADGLADGDRRLDAEGLLAALRAATREVAGVEAVAAARTLLGDAIGANVLLLGFAWQRGWLPVSEAALLRAVELNGVAVDMNRRAFALGRLAAADGKRLRDWLRRGADGEPGPLGLDELVERHVVFLREYQDAAYGERYRALVTRARAAEAERCGEAGPLAAAVARAWFRLLAYKDEYEVARLYTSPEFRASLDRELEGVRRVRYHLAPPLFARRDPATGRLRKRAYGPWILAVFGLLRRLRFLRGTALDVFLLVPERREERRLIREYEALVDELLARLSPATHALCVELAGLAERVRGYDVVKKASIARYEARKAELLARLRAAQTSAAERTMRPTIP